MSLESSLGHGEEEVSEQIVTVLRQIEVLMAQVNLRRRLVGTPGYRSNYAMSC